MEDEANDFSAMDDVWKSVNEAFRVIRERVAAGGPPWQPHVTTKKEDSHAN